MSRTSGMTDDERTLLDCSDKDIAVVSYADSGEEEDESLDIAMALEKPVIAIKHPDLARDISFWLKIGQYYRKASIVSSVGAGVFSAFGFQRLSKVLAISSAIVSAVYCTAWHWDPMYVKYHLLENPRLLVLLGKSYRKGANIVLVRNKQRNSFWVPTLGPLLALCIAYGNTYTLL